ncbi:hypothetical protein WJ0W_003542 [Paenibacillus melissococcoides]|uniref:Uncharacterized protein n=1 Tax=Paenibacillus melissococcoides TaxID=2912268 RepID=A0ABN8U5G5_9BACL|nr:MULTISPECIES: hypothetical protein [Paenibacillus]GIO82253.1 hypothetical protein J6TS7_58630 [Paenibacillus dendritiformis]CAH8246307.1 hypothetical protein WJ0W_003542 [Paenibacillus melissococcoides]CAH8713577.1 hypothetical protein WDD9_003614 [Paenibacillus melissococcoides]CAH8714310.1 hypothetical protein HTL2_003917 [Paenibacillus melissococcoides]
MTLEQLAEIWGERSPMQQAIIRKQIERREAKCPKKVTGFRQHVMQIVMLANYLGI